jgi:ATP-binding cassette subfamily C protein
LITADIPAFTREFLRDAGWRAWATGALMVLLGTLDGIGLLLLLPLLAAAGIATDASTPIPGALERWLPTNASLEGIVLIYLAVVLSYAALKLAGVWLNATLIQRYSAQTRIRTHAQLTHLSWQDILRHKGGDVAHALTTNVDTLVRGALALLQFATSAVLFAVQLAIALYLSPPLALAAIAVLAVAGLGGRGFYRKVFSDARATVASGQRLHHGAEDFVRRHRHVRAFDNEELSQREFAAEARTLADKLRTMQWTMGQARFLTEAAALLLIAGTFYVGFTALQIPLATLVVFTVVLARLLPRAMALQREAQVIASALPARRALITISSTAATRPCGRGFSPDSSKAKLVDPVSTITWQNLHFQLDKLHWRVDQLELRKGQLTALVGPSGIGKSVLCDALAGLLTPQSGHCSVNGAPLPAGARLSAAVRLGYLAQHSRPWQGTVGSALRWAAPAAGDPDCWAALEQAGLAQVVRTRDGLATPLGDAALWLSGGELHRLALAQVLMRKPQVLILDEPSAALDADTELGLIKTIKALVAERPVLVVTHRESVARAADEVLAMEETADGTRKIALP